MATKMAADTYEGYKSSTERDMRIVLCSKLRFLESRNSNIVKSMCSDQWLLKIPRWLPRWLLIPMMAINHELSKIGRFYPLKYSFGGQGIQIW